MRYGATGYKVEYDGNAAPNAPYSFCLFPIPDSRFPIPDSRFPTPYSLLPTPYSLVEQTRN
ncbi:MULTISPECIES: hypothetical protein [Moorena]|uniref:hypothetical protein n=1 Tax=Moorena TaxID=1155738 RepID=UPI0002E5728F|nr:MULTISPECIES: hypothetical protein [Moorena]